MVTPRIVTDQMGRAVSIPYNAHRIVSLVPSQTELLFDLGLGDKVVGITKFCIHPKEWFDTKTRVGGTKALNFDVIEALQPDLIIGNKEENNQQDIEALMKRYPVWMSDIKTLDEAKDMIYAIGDITNSQAIANQIMLRIDASFAQIPLPKLTRSALYFIWQKPYMTAGTDTFINHLMQRCGFKKPSFVSLNVAETRYPELTASEISQLAPEFIFLSSEPYPFKEKHIAEFQSLLPAAKVMLIDGEMFSWYGSRLIQAGSYLAALVSGT